MEQTNTSNIRPVINRVFTGLSVKYHPWFCKGMDEKTTLTAKRDWARQLRNFSDERILHALDIVTQHYPGKPVMIGEFYKLCVTRPEHRQAEPLKLEILKSSTVIGREALDKMHKLLGKVTVTESEEMDEAAIVDRKKVLAAQAEQFERDHQAEFLP